MSASVERTDDYNDEIDLRKYLEVIWRRKNIVAGMFVAAIIVTLAAGMVTPRQWQAKTTVMVPEPPKIEQAQVVGGFQATQPAIVYSQETYARLLKSTVLLERVIAKLGLRMEADDLAEKVTARPIRDTRLIEITVRGGADEDVAAIAGALAEALVGYDREVISAELTQARKFVETQLERAKEDLQAKEEVLKEFNQRENLAALEGEVNRSLGQLSSLRQAYEQNRIDLGVASQRLAQVRRELALTSPLRLSVMSAQTNTLGPSIAAQLRAKLADLQTQRAALLERYSPSHPTVIAIDAQIQQTREELAKAGAVEPRAQEQRTNTVREQLEGQKATLEVEGAGLQARDRLLARAIVQAEVLYRSMNTRLAEKRAELIRLTREADIAKNTFTTLSAKATEAVVAEGMKSGFVRVVDRAVARPVPKEMATRMALATMLGLVTGVLVAFVAEYFRIPSPALAEVPPASNPHSTRRKEAEV